MIQVVSDLDIHNAAVPTTTTTQCDSMRHPSPEQSPTRDEPYIVARYLRDITGRIICSVDYDEGSDVRIPLLGPIIDLYLIAHSMQAEDIHFIYDTYMLSAGNMSLFG